MLRQTIRTVWTLFFCLGVIGLCIGAQGTLLGVRAELEGFDTRATGLLMSAYYLGFCSARYLRPRSFSGSAMCAPSPR